MQNYLFGLILHDKRDEKDVNSSSFVFSLANIMQIRSKFLILGEARKYQRPASVNHYEALCKSQQSKKKKI